MSSGSAGNSGFSWKRDTGVAMTLLTIAGVIANCIGAVTVIGVFGFIAGNTLGVLFSSSVSLEMCRAGVNGTVFPGVIWANGLRGVSASRRVLALKDNFLMGRPAMSKPLLPESARFHQNCMQIQGNKLGDEWKSSSIAVDEWRRKLTRR